MNTTPCLTAAAIVLATMVMPVQAELVSVIGGSLRANEVNVVVKATFLSTQGLLTNELFLDSPVNPHGKIFSSQTSPVNATVNLGPFQPDAVLFFRNQAFLPSPNPGGPASFNFGYFLGTGTIPLNPDRLPHAVITFDPDDLSVPVIVGFEDIFGGGDFDFNDAVYSFTNVKVGFVDIALSPVVAGGDYYSVNSGDTHTYASFQGNYSNAGTIDNDGEIINYGEGSLDGMLNNLGDLFNDMPGQFHITSSGQITNNSQGIIRSFGEMTNDGQVNNSGTVSNGGTMTNTGTIVNDSTGNLQTLNELLNDEGGTIDNQGVINIIKGALESKGDIYNSGTMTNEQATAIINGYIQNAQNGTLINLGDLKNTLGSDFDNFGFFDNSGAVSIGGKMVNTGTVVNQSTGDLQTLNELLNDEGGTIDNQGEINIIKGALESKGDIYNSGTITNEEAKLIIQGYIENAQSGSIINLGELKSMLGSDFDNYGSVSNSGTFTIESGASVNGDGTYTQNAAGASTEVQGQMTQSTINIQAGTVKGTGTINGALNAGSGATISPGNSPGTLTVNGDFTLDGGTLEIELASLFDHDLLDITGQALFNNGTINYVFTYTPNLDDLFIFLTADAGFSGFDSLNFTASGLPSGMAVVTGWIENQSLVAVVVPAIPEPATFLLLCGVLSGLCLHRPQTRPRSNR